MGLGPKNYIWTNWANKDSFIYNQEVNSMNFTNVKIKPHTGVWGLKLGFRLTGPEELSSWSPKP